MTPAFTMCTSQITLFAGVFSCPTSAALLCDNIHFALTSVSQISVNASLIVRPFDQIIAREILPPEVIHYNWKVLGLV